jgi:hypothetical protein
MVIQWSLILGFHRLILGFHIPGLFFPGFFASFAPRLYLWYGERRDQCVGSQDDLQMMHMMLVMLVMCFLLLVLMMMMMMVMMMMMNMDMDLKSAENEDNDDGECDGDEM